MYTLHRVVTRPKVSRSTSDIQSIKEAFVILINSFAQI